MQVNHSIASPVTQLFGPKTRASACKAKKNEQGQEARKEKKK
jgi:hypothetical protein